MNYSTGLWTAVTVMPILNGLNGTFCIWQTIVKYVTRYLLIQIIIIGRPKEPAARPEYYLFKY